MPDVTSPQLDPPALDPPGLDPVCGMTVAPDNPRRFEHGGVRYGFCSDGCLQKFRADPERWLQPRREEPPPGSADAG